MNDVFLLNGRPVTVGSSDVASILGLSPYGGPWQTWCRLVGLTERYTNVGDGAQQRGRMFEPAIGHRWLSEHAEEALREGWVMQPGPPIGMPARPGPLPWMSCREDFAVGRPAEAITLVVEAKSCRMFDPSWDDGPIEYITQATWQNTCIRPVRGVTIAAFATIQEEYREIVVCRNEKLERKITRRVWDWYERHVLGETPPPIDGSDGCSTALGLMHKQTRQTFRDATETDRALARDLHRLRREIAELEVQQTLVENTLKDSVGEYAGIEGVLTWREQKGSTRLNIPSEIVKTYVPEHIIEKYAVRGKPHRVLRLKAEKEADNG